MKKIWICGSSGMLGSHFKRVLSQKHISFIANEEPKIDITDLDLVSDFIRKQKISHVINCAAYTKVDEAETDQKKAYLVNAVGPHHLGIAGRRHGARVLHFSTDYVFDGKGRSPYSEDHFCTPISAYGMSKLAGEIKLLDEHKNACIIRTSWLFGISGKNFAATMLQQMQEKEELRVIDDQVGRPTYCHDLAETALHFLDEAGVFHFANAFETSWYKFAKEIHRQAGDLGFPLKTKNIHPISSKEYPSAASRPNYSTLSTKKIEGHLGKSVRSWQEALQDYLIHLKQTQLSPHHSHSAK